MHAACLEVNYPAVDSVLSCLVVEGKEDSMELLVPGLGEGWDGVGKQVTTEPVSGVLRKAAQLARGAQRCIITIRL